MIGVYRAGLAASMQEISVLSNNIANASTIGFKRSETNFNDLYAVEKSRRSDLQLGSGVQTLQPRRLHLQGSFLQTDAALDLAINGEGMFALRNPSDPKNLQFTRNGSINLAEDGRLVTMDGFEYLDTKSEPIKIPFEVTVPDGQTTETRRLSAINVASDGNIRVEYGSGVLVDVANIGLATFVNEAELRSLGSTYYAETPKSGPAVIAPGQDNATGTGSIQSGALENSNTDSTAALSRLLKAQQAFSGSARLMQADADMVRRLIG